MKIYIGADHNGFQLKQALISYLSQLGHEVIDKGDTQLNPQDDFPQYGAKVASAILSSDDKNAKGVLICGSGQGVCIAANRFKGIRAALAWNRREAQAARNDDDSNVLCLPARELDEKSAMDITETWLNTAFSAAPRYIRRNRQLDELN